MSRSMIKRVIVALVTSAFVSATGICIWASTTVGSTIGDVPNPAYNYSPSVIVSGSLYQYWWCAEGVDPKDQLNDTIQYESINLQTHAVVGPEKVLAETAGTWDQAHLCNPKVLKGTFVNPLGNGLTYTYAMYYVGTSDSSGIDNSIGVAFSNDGVTWTKYPTPVQTYSSQESGTYGVGQPAVYNHNGQSNVWLFYESPQGHFETTSTDGVHFTYQGELATNGLGQVSIAGQPQSTPLSWGDMAYDPKTGYWYAAFNMSVRPASTTGNVEERGQPGIVIYRILGSSLLTGATHWEQIASIDTNLTGYESNFLGGFDRNPDGTIDVAPYYPNIEIYTSISSPRPAWNATPKVRGNSGDISHWNLLWDLWVANATLVPFKRYSGGGTYEVTTGYVDTGIFSLQSTLGYLYESPQGGAIKALYACIQGSTDYFVSTDSACEGNLFLGINGYSYPTASQPNLVQIYRCYNGAAHFVSTDPNCEGSSEEYSLGFIPISD